MGLLEFFRQFENWKPAENKWFADKIEEDKKHYFPNTPQDETISDNG